MLLLIFKILLTIVAFTGIFGLFLSIIYQWNDKMKKNNLLNRIISINAFIFILSFLSIITFIIILLIWSNWNILK